MIVTRGRSRSRWPSPWRAAALRPHHSRARPRPARASRARPSPAEIYPIISVGLRKIAEAPLDAANLDQAESLLRNALGLQADESSALNGIQAIAQLRLVNTAIANKDEAAAHSALTAAQDALASIGLGESTLRAAKDAVEGMTR